MEVFVKKCYKCQQELGLEFFGKNKSKADGLATECRSCKSQQDKKYYLENRDLIRKKDHEYYLKNKEQIYDNTFKYQKTNPHKVKEYSLASRVKIKTDVLAHYSQGSLKCKHCNCDDLTVLTIDHIDGNGSDHRKEIFGSNKSGGGCRFYFWLKRNGFPEGFQVLCFNCNFRKRFLEMQPESSTHLQEVRAKYARNIKLECLDNYGGRNCVCGEKDTVVLTLDHVNDDGADHRKKTGTRGFNFYMMLRKNQFPNNPPLQVLCLNCQIRKRDKKNG